MTDTQLLFRTVYVCLTRYKSAEVISKFAKCLATLPNLTTIHGVATRPSCNDTRPQ